MTPIFKKGKKSDHNNYRPVSLTSAVCKLIETIIRVETVKHVEYIRIYSVLLNMDLEVIGHVAHS